MQRFLAALGCLTIVPVGLRSNIQERALGGSWLWFPVVGLLIGLVLVGVHTAALRFFPPLVVGACVLLTWIVFTGAIHLDGFADVCDGLYAGHTSQERLRIMKDPHIGAIAVIGLSGLLLFKFTLISSLTQAVVAPALLLTPCLGRYAMVVLGTTLPYARTEAGAAAAFVRHATPGSLVGATVAVLLIACLLWRWTGLALLGVSVIVSLILRPVFRHTLGGITGDALGAAGELTEVLMLIGASLTMSR